MGDIIRVKAGATFVFILKKMKMIVGGRVSEGFIKSLRVTVNQLRHIQKTQGNKGLIIYLKTCQICLQQAASGYHVSNTRSVGSRISRTKGSCYPRIIPVQHRIIMLNDKPGKFIYLKFYLTLFYVYRVINIKNYVVKLNSITDNGKIFTFTDYFTDKIGHRFLSLFIKQKAILHNPVEYLSRYSRFFSILKASPNSVTDDSCVRLWSTHPIVMLKSAMAINMNPIVRDCIQYLSQFYFPFLWRVLNQIYYGQSASLGKLSFKEEAAGKLRVFAIVDCFTQWLLNPLHKVIFLILRRIPMDGTFDQLRPIHRLIRMNCKQYYSLDLTAATDRLPISIQKWILNLWIIDIPLFGSVWSKLLVNRKYRWTAPDGADCSKSGPSGLATYSVGQPMGALSSWAMLALTHHLLVQVAAWSVGYPKHKLYTRYALLGDDLVISDKYVANSYLKLMDAIGVGINLSKSILSPKGLGLEFAKRTFVNGQDVSPISFRELSESLQPGNISSWVAFANQQKLNFCRQARILGFGYKTNVLSFRKMNHALKVLYLTNIAKIDFNTDVLKLQYKAPIDLNLNVQSFIETVLKPILRDLQIKLYGRFADLTHPQVLENVRSTDESLAVKDTVENFVEDGGKESMYKIVTGRLMAKRLNGSYFYKTTTYSFLDSDDPKDQMKFPKFKSVGINEDPELTDKNLKSLMVYLHQQVVADEVPLILEQLRQALSTFDLRLIKTMDECLNAYVVISRLKAIQEIAALRLQGVELTPSKKLPMQARLFRSWSRLTHRLAKSL